MDFAQRGPVLVIGGGGQPLDPLYHGRDARFLCLELTDGPGGIASEIGNEGLKPSLLLRVQACQFLNGVRLGLTG